MESEHSYLVSGLLGKLHVITMDDRSNIVVMKADVQHNICPFQSTNSCPFSQSSPVSAAGSGSGSETGLWKVIARKVAFSTDLNYRNYEWIREVWSSSHFGPKDDHVGLGLPLINDSSKFSMELTPNLLSIGEERRRRGMSRTSSGSSSGGVSDQGREP
ncbi:hypothetical protein SAY86_006458 [Trapa natans]|uniref:Uncharacterized protein n=1 Tax=Trapa natans TaxID=22666 RepID=A0AAN7LC34_TRANT|nr:hypothetical protein SAY86_006458 [Trapa natans]